MSADDAQVPPDDDVAAIVRRAELLGIPAWRVTTALAVPVESEPLPAVPSVDDGPGVTQAQSNPHAG